MGSGGGGVGLFTVSTSKMLTSYFFLCSARSALGLGL